jgi:transposase
MATAKKTRAAAAHAAKSTGNRYPKEYRREALRQLDSGRSLGDVAAEFNVSVGTLQRWRLMAASEVSGPNGESLTAENDRLKKELRELKTELDIAKKAALFFARRKA